MWFSAVWSGSGNGKNIVRIAVCLYLKTNNLLGHLFIERPNERHEMRVHISDIRLMWETILYYNMTMDLN